MREAHARRRRHEGEVNVSAEARGDSEFHRFLSRRGMASELDSV
jgi:hypothetical protein